MSEPSIPGARPDVLGPREEGVLCSLRETVDNLRRLDLDVTVGAVVQALLEQGASLVEASVDPESCQLLIQGVPVQLAAAPVPGISITFPSPSP